MSEPTPDIITYVLGGYQTNCFVVRVPDASKCWIVDCGFEPRQMLDDIERRGLKPIAILLTHAHPDHMAGVDAALDRFGDLPIWIHETEADWLEDPMKNMSAVIDRPVTCRAADHLLKGDETLDLNGTTWRVLHTPGHSPGGVCFVHDASKQAIVGDTIFAGSIGRVDFPSSDPDVMRRTLHEVLMALPDEMTIHPGHGPATTIGHERATNPFIVGGF